MGILKTKVISSLIRAFYCLVVILFFSLCACSKKSTDGNSFPEVVNASDSLQAKYIIWDSTTRQKIAPLANRNAGYCGYARMIQLQDKSLLCIYEISGGNIECSKSFDTGKTWSVPVIVAANQNGINCAVPEILQLNNQTLLASYNLRPASYDSTKHYGICTKKSFDGGLTWQAEKLLYQAGAKAEEGCWEPAQIQLPSGEIQLYFSNEGVYPNSNEQNISIFRSDSSGLNWSASPQMVSFRAGARDGMPVPIFLKSKNEILFSIEDNGTGQFSPAIIRNTLTQNWNVFVDGASADRNTALAQPLSNTIYAGAPYLRQLITGETILSYQSAEGRGTQWELSCMNVVIGDENGKNFTHKSVPFNVPVNKSGLWNSLCVLDDNTVVAITSTNAYSLSNNMEVWMIKGHLVKK